MAVNASASESRCYGTTSNGALLNGRELPASGNNFESYSRIARLAGRSYVHSVVRTIVVDSYKALESELPSRIFKYGETGFEEGGPFKPHKTHQNGLSVDFMVPVMNRQGESVYFSTTPFNRFGYAVEFDNMGRFEEYIIDYEAMAAHIVALHKAAKRLGYDLWRVIFDPQLQTGLYSTRYGDYLRKNIRFSKKPSWVRHDEHYHVDFLIPCEKLSP